MAGLQETQDLCRAVVMFAHGLGLSREDEKEGRRRLALLDDERAGGKPARLEMVGDGTEIARFLGKMQQVRYEVEIAPEARVVADQPLHHPIEEAPSLRWEVRVVERLGSERG